MVTLSLEMYGCKGIYTHDDARGNEDLSNFIELFFNSIKDLNSRSSIWCWCKAIHMFEHIYGVRFTDGVYARMYGELKNDVTNGSLFNAIWAHGRKCQRGVSFEAWSYFGMFKSIAKEDICKLYRFFDCILQGKNVAITFQESSGALREYWYIFNPTHYALLLEYRFKQLSVRSYKELPLYLKKVSTREVNKLNSKLPDFVDLRSEVVCG